ncbi:hypothetical protein M3936_02690 [Sutcliffiella horikoshii]|uniref:poly(ethylene terephthalate) hydrolase family protein n=1 Tax=Sutcliffiella horikoshii TaxID=79883 RepID=UPI00203E50B6|nr:hypothetical protein [Sutcliffiella horikoshii]MCM3616481.1 hypothetical protein [Sutcliffiella horikoshii]
MKKLKTLYNKFIQKATGFIISSWRYVVISILFYMTVFVLVMSYFFYSGAGKWFDILFVSGIGVLAIVLGGFLSIPLLKLLERLPKFLTAGIIGCICTVYSVGAFMGPFFRLMAFFIIVLGALAGIAIFLYKKGAKTLFLSFSVFTLIVHSILMYFALTDGKEGTWSLKLSTEEGVVENPAVKGEYSIQHFTYGSGEDKQREEFTDVMFKTHKVNMSPFIVHPTGLNKWYREWFWGFNLNNAPLNGRVWMPKIEEEGQFPLVLIVHGNHNMADFSDGGYSYLGELLASKGYIVVSVDQNFINSGKTGHIGWDNAGRAWLLLKHLETWQRWNTDKSHTLFNKVDMENIALIGHSRGGEAVSIASMFNELDRFPNNAKISLNFDFSIKSLIGLSPGDGRFKPGDKPVVLKDVNYLTIQGGNDTDHTNYLGMRQFQRVQFSEGFDGYKSSVYINGGNHGQFNSDWEVDQPSPYWWFMNRKELIDPELQRDITKLYVTSFLDSTLKGKREYRTYFSDKEAVAPFIPVDPLRVRYESSDFQHLSTFEEDVDVTTTTIEGGSIQGYNLHVWKEVNLLQRNKEQQDNQVVKLGWRNKNSRYSVNLPEELSARFTDETILKFDAVQAHPSRYEFYHIPIPEENAAIPVTVLIKPKGTNRLDSRIKKTIYIEPTYTTKLYRFDWWNERFGNQYEHMLQTYEVPLNYLEETIPGLDYRTINELTFEFNQTESGLIFLDNIGFDDE